MNYSNHNLLHLLNQSVRLMNQRMNEKLKEYDLYTSQWAIIYCLHKNGPMTLTDIWQYMNVEAPTVTRTVKRLEEKGWLSRKPGTDKRQRIVHIADNAKDEVSRLADTIRSYEDEQLFHLSTEEENQLRQLLEQITSN
ncbi:MarR family winged helix-turn-helix transcriptional regulator [Halobacillus salinus]|uniref:MarR family winged helix-turn-helix transcriptional regulator n=1 Tax=Halobacillus salinus TaxID=192814 RepID=UPI0009A89F37|nr:MarR family transcriptional regulator [Halobacillus salinus]